MGRPKKVIAPQCTVIGRNSTDPEAVIKREVSTQSQINRQEDTLIYGDGDNLPLRIAQVVNESPAASACTKTKAKYIKGSEFSNRDLMRIKVDKYGTTLWDLHTKLSDMLALFEGFAVNFKFDANGGITNSFVLSFESVRLSKPDTYGFITSVKYNPYFGVQEFKKEFTTCYPVWDKQEVLNQIEEEGTKFNGQVYYYGKTSPLYRFYPVPDYWSAKNWINIDGKIQEFHASNLEKGFFQTVVWNIIGDPSKESPNPEHWREYTENGVKRKKSTTTQGKAFTEMMTEAFAGAQKSGGGIGLWSQNVDTATKFTAFPTNQNHDLFTALQDLTTKNITIAFQTPGILANISEGTNLGSGGSEIQKAIELMQSNTKEDRNRLEQFYNEVLLPNLAEPVSEKVEIVNYNPVTVPVEIDDKFWEAMDADERRDFMRKNVPGVTLKEAVVVATAAPVEPLPDGSMPVVETQPVQQTNEALKNLKIADLNKIQKIVARYNLYLADNSNTKGVTYEQAKQMLAPFGFTEEELNAWLVTPEEL